MQVRDVMTPSVVTVSREIEKYTTETRNRDVRDFQDCFHIKLLQLFLRITTGVKEFIQHLDLILKSCFVFHENTSLANVDYNRNTATLFFFLRIA